MIKIGWQRRSASGCGVGCTLQQSLPPSCSKCRPLGFLFNKQDHWGGWTCWPAYLYLCKYPTRKQEGLFNLRKENKTKQDRKTTKHKTAAKDILFISKFLFCPEQFSKSLSRLKDWNENNFIPSPLKCHHCARIGKPSWPQIKAKLAIFVSFQQCVLKSLNRSQGEKLMGFLMALELSHSLLLKRGTKSSLKNSVCFSVCFILSAITTERVTMNPLWIHFLTSWESHCSRAARRLSSVICMRKIVFVSLNQEWLDYVQRYVQTQMVHFPCLLWLLLCMEECCLWSEGLKSRKVPYPMVEHY